MPDLELLKMEGPDTRRLRPAGSKARVLLVEDDADTREYVAALLDPRYAVESEADGAAALARARQHPPDLVLSDVRMPVLDGFELLRELRADERTKTIPVILLSARSEADSRVEGFQSGADDYLVKPFQARELLARVSSSLKLARLRKERELEARELNVALESKVQERTRELESFAYTVAHDLRAPLRAMSGFSHALLEDFGDRLGDEGRDYARRILEAGRRMDAMIRDLLAYSRLGREPLTLADVDLNEAVDEALAEMAPELRERRAKVDVERPLPRVRAHPVTLRRALANLLSNAVKFVAAGVEPQVRIRAEGPRLWIEDNGIGIAPEYHERIFGVFERLHGPATYPGTGIGLAIVKKAMERMGGRAGLRSEVGKGSRFFLEFQGQEQAAPP